MAEKSGIEMLEEIMNKVDLLSKKVDVLDQNIKKIANSTKISELITKAQESNIAGWTKPKEPVTKQTTDPKGMRFKFESVDASKIKQDSALINKNNRVSSNKVGMVKGKMITLNNGQQVPLPDITIKIFDGKNKMLKETKTNRAGQWMAQLQPGKYVVEMTGKYKDQELTPQNKVFELLPGVEELEVK